MPLTDSEIEFLRHQYAGLELSGAKGDRAFLKMHRATVSGNVVVLCDEIIRLRKELRSLRGDDKV